MMFSRSQALNERSHAVIPGGAHTYAKGEDQFPQEMPVFIARGDGCHAWDVDGNEYIEYGMGLRAVTLGHGYKPVVEAARKQMLEGLNFVRPMALEVEAAEAFLRLLPGMEMVKFAKNGSDVTSAAVKLARAYTGRDRIAVSGDHPFFSVDDWFIGTTAMHAGIPQSARDLTVKFKFNDLASIEALFNQYPNQIACIITEAESSELPRDQFLHKAQDLCHRHGALFILDEVITGFRWHLGGAQRVHDFVPDLATFGKAMGNGFSIAALAGKREFMQLGGLRHDQKRVFLLSTTHGTESHCLAAAMEVWRIYEREAVTDFLHAQGERLAAGIRRVTAAHHLQDYFGVQGRPCALVYYTLDPQKQRSQPYRTLFLQELIKRGVLAPNLIVSYSHTDRDIDRTIDIIDQSLGVYRKAIDEGVEKYLKGRPVKPVFREFN